MFGLHFIARFEAKSVIFIYHEKLKISNANNVLMLDCRAQILWGPLCVVGI